MLIGDLGIKNLGDLELDFTMNLDRWQGWLGTVGNCVGC